MLRILLGIVALGAIALTEVRSPAVSLGDAVGIGQSAPAFLIDTIDGHSISSDFHGRPAYINFFATWCPPCRGELPSILAQMKRYGDRIDFLFVDEQEPPNIVKTFATGLGVVTPIAVDRGQFAATFAVGGLPWSIFIDRHGVVQYIYRGLIPANVLVDQLAKLASS